MKDWKGNKNSVYKIIAASNHAEIEREQMDYYATDPKTIDKLLEVEELSHCIWECAAGENHLANRLKEKGFQVITSDIVERKSKIDYITDFLKVNQGGIDCDILTNPPYKFAKEFVLKALSLVKNGRKICMFLKLTFLEGKARLREIFSTYPPRVVHVFSERVLCAKNGKFDEIDKGGSAVAYAWFIWEKGWHGDTVVDWI